MVSDIDDGVLLRAWQGGDRAAGSALFDRHVAAVTRFFRSKIEREVEDLVQETFLACVRAAEGFRGDASFRAYLLGIARHKLYDHLARRSRDPFDPATRSAVDLGASPASALARAEEHRLLLAALRSIPIDHQVALELFYWEGLSGEEIAAVTGVASNTVRSRLARARAALEEALARLAESPSTLTSTVSDLDGWARTLAAAIGGAAHSSPGG